MPLLIPTDELQPGMKLFEPVVVNGQLMLHGGRLLSASDVAIIRRRFPAMCVRIEDPLLDRLLEFEDDTRERRIAAEAQRRVSACLAQVGERFAVRESLSAVDVGLLRLTVTELIEYLSANRVSAALVTACTDSRTYLGTHTGNVFYLSLLLGNAAMDYVISERRRQIRAREVSAHFAHDLTPLGLAALVMDIGMLPLQHLARLPRPLTPAERAAVRRHPLDSFNALPPTFSAVARVVVKMHHENFCGTGYPRGIPGHRQHVFARLLRIADAFDAATSERIYHGAKSPARVLWEMTRGPYRRFYDPRLMHTFAGLIQPFPIGSKLRLADGRYAAVVRYRRQQPFDPVVVIAFDAHDRPLPPEQLEGPLSLSSRPELRVATLNGEDLSFLYAPAPDEPGPSMSELMPLSAAYP